ncbi:ABC transporter permease [candidate division KSB1 bacterium]
MFKEIYLRELLDKLVTVRFVLIIFLALLVSISGMMGFKDYYLEGANRSIQARTELERKQREAAEKRLVDAIAVQQTYYLPPRLSELLVTGHKEASPNLFEFNSFVMAIPQATAPTNPFYEKPLVPDWYFIVAILFSFLALTLAYDTVSGEKFDGTLSLTLANTISRSSFLLAKYSALMSILVMAMILSGLLWIILALSYGLPVLTASFIKNIALFGFLSVVYLSLITLGGMLVSVWIKSPSAGMVMLLAVWVFITFLVPGTGRLIAERMGGVVSEKELLDMHTQVRRDMFDSLPEGSKAGSWGGDKKYQLDPEGRFALETRIREAIHRLNVEHVSNQLYQVRKTMSILSISPATAFKTISEAIAGVGIVRLNRLIGDIQIYQKTLRDFYFDTDRNDPDSRHLLLPQPSSSYQTYGSQKSVDYESIPKFVERDPSVAEALNDAGRQLVYLLFLNIFLFALTWVSFLRADVRRMG